jgi:hypothetical protein
MVCSHVRAAITVASGLMANPPPHGPSPFQALMGLLHGRIISHAVSVAAEIGVADHVEATPTPVARLAAATGANADALYRVLRALASVGVFTESEGRAFALTPLSSLLRSDAPGSLRSMARMLNRPPNHGAWGAFEHSVRTGESAFEKAHGTPTFEYFGQHLDEARIFDEAMGGFTTAAGRAVAKAYDFTDVKHLVDVGGSQGVLLSAVLDAFPQVKATLFDLPHVIDGARSRLAAGRHAGRIEVAQGSFLDAVPAGADAYIMKSILHDWPDDVCITILSKCREAMAPGGRVLVVEGLVTNAPQAMYVKLLDLQMLTMTSGGRERTEAEFAALFGRAGLRLVRVVPTESAMSVVEARAS